MATLTLKKVALSPEKRAEVQKLKSLHKTKVEDKPLSFEDIKRAEKWLFKTYPLLFRRTYDKIFKIGIERDIFQKGNLPCSRSLIRKAIGYVVHHPQYLKNTIEGTKRCNLDGQEVEDITPNQKEHAQKALARFEEKHKAS